MRPRRDPLDHPWLFGTIAALYAVSIPWWFGSERPSVVLGMPSWAAFALLATFAVSVLTALACLRLWDDGEASDGACRRDDNAES